MFISHARASFLHLHCAGVLEFCVVRWLVMSSVPQPYVFPDVLHLDRKKGIVKFLFSYLEGKFCHGRQKHPHVCGSFCNLFSSLIYVFTFLENYQRKLLGFI